MKKLFTLQFLILSLISLISTQGLGQLTTNAFTGTATCPTQGNTFSAAMNAAVSSLTRNTITCTTAANVFNSTTLNNTGNRNDDSYIEFSITANSGYSLNLTSFSFFRQASATAPNSLIVSYSTDPSAANFNSTRVDMAVSINPTTGTILTWTFPTAITTTNGGKVTFRFYPFGTVRADGGAAVAAATGTFRLDDVSLFGSVNSVSSTQTVNLSVNSNTASEASPAAITVTATASAPVAGAQTVILSVSGTNITSGDYTLTNTTITIPDGQTTGTSTFTVVNDNLIEGTETAILTISNPSAGITLGTTTTQNITITDDDFPAVNLSVSSNNGSEAAATSITVTATASQAVTGDQTVSLGVSGTNITSGDYTLSNTIITIPNGATTGSVTFTVVDDNLVEGQETATLTISNPSGGITLGGTTVQNITITDNDVAAATTTSLTSSANPSTTAQTVTFTATVNTVSGTPTGTVTFSIDGTSIVTISLSGNTASYNSSALPAGSYNITATYNGDANYASSTSSALTQVVNTSSSNTSLTSSLNPSLVGQSVTFTATVTVANNTSTGTVTFLDGTTTLATVNLSGNSSTYSTTALNAGSHSITARYNGDANNAASTSTALNQTVNTPAAASTTTSLTSSINPSTVGQSVTITATVSTATGTPTGTVTFFLEGNNIGTFPLSGNTAVFSTSALPIGSFHFTATYNGDANYTASTSAVLTQVVNQAVTTISVSSSLNPSTIGQSITFTATITGASGTPTGTVTFFDGTTNLGSGNVSGTTATFSTSALSVGSHSITAMYNGDANNAAGTSSAVTQVVNKFTTSIIVSSSVNPSIATQGVNFEARLTASSATPTGTVTFLDGTTVLGTGTVSSSGTSSGFIAVYSTAGLSLGSHNITAVYNGDANNNTSTSPVLIQVVNKASTTTTISSIPNPSTVGQNVIFNVSINGTIGTPVGTVTFFDGTTNIGTVNLSGGSTTFTTSSLSVGSHNITATYNGDANNAASTSSALTQVVNKATTTTSVTSSLNPSTVGQNIIFTATISGASGTPTGNIIFFDGATILGFGNVSGTTATLTISALSVGSHSITAMYNGDVNNAVSTSSVLTQVVNKAATTTSITSSLNPSTIGQSVTFTAKIIGASGTPTGNVTFFDGAANLGFGNVSGTTATLTTSLLSVGSHSITAMYNGDANNAVNTSSALMQVVNKAATAISFSSSANPSTVGQSVTFTASITGAFGTPTGTVTFFDGTTNLGSGNISGTTATFTTSVLSASSHNITAMYNGDANNSVSTSTILSQVVNKIVTSTSIISSLNPSSFGQSVTFTATVSGTPTGTVTFFDGTANIGSGALSGNAATISTSALTAGVHNITATYNGDVTFAASTSATLSQTVNKLTSSVSLTSSINPSTVQQSVTFTATVSVPSGSPTGSVTFASTTTIFGTVTLSGNTATLSTTGLAADTNKITATYNGDAIYTSNQSPVLIQIVNKFTTTTTLASSVNPSSFGQTVMFTATVSAASGFPGGSVTFFDGAANLGTYTLNPAGGPSVPYYNSTLTPGSHNITARYNGDATAFAASTSNVLIQVVNNKLSSTTSVTSSLNPSVIGQSVTFTANVSSASGTPIGSVTFFDGTTNIGSGTLSGNNAMFSTSALIAGSHSITATYNGDAAFFSSTSASLTQTVNNITTTTSLTSSLNPSLVGQSVTFTAIVSANSGTPTGTVTFNDGSVSVSTAALSGNAATFTTSSLSAGTHSISAVYNGNANYPASTAPVLIQNVTIISSITDYFRSKTAGNWNDINTWQSSPDNVNWYSASLTPDYNSNTINVFNIVIVTANLTIDQTNINSNASLIINPNVVLTVNDGPGIDLFIGYGGPANMTIKSTSAGTGSIGNSSGTIQGNSNVIVERYFSNRRAWRLLGLPFLYSSQSIASAWMETVYGVMGPLPGYGTQITTFKGDPNAANFDGVGFASSIRTYSGDSFTSDATHTPNTNQFIINTAGPAYFLFVRGDRSIDRTTTTASSATTLRIAGTLTTGNVTKGVTGTGFSLIPNPYPSAIDFDAVKALAGNTDITRFYVWDASLGGTNGIGQYRTIDITGNTPNYTYTSTPSGGSPNADNNWRFIESGTAFFVSGNRQVNFTEATKSSGIPPSSMLRTASSNQTELVINLNKINPDYTISLADGVREVFDNIYSADNDKNDAKKLEGFGANLGIVNNNEVLAIDKRPLPKQDDIIPLKLWNGAVGNYQFEIDPNNFNVQNLSVYLRDNLLNTATPIDLNNTTKINFTTNGDTSSSAANRFSIVFAKPASIVNATPSIVVYPNPVSNGNIQLQFTNMPQGKYSVRLLNNLGQLITTKQIIHPSGSSTENLNVNGITKGIYQVEITKPDNTRISQKVITD